jgi:imidazolonepropionase
LSDLLIRNARIVTLAAGEIPRRGEAMRELAILPSGDVLINDGVIEQVGSGIKAPTGAPIIDANGRVCMPGFIDAHTHAIWAGDRLDEIDRKQQGASYLDILKSGGGIMATVRAVRSASREELAGNLRRRLDVALREGTTTIEVKSGYGLTTADELKSLRAIADASDGFPGTVVPTALIAHAIDPEQPDFVRVTIKETLPAVHAEFPQIAIDAYCEEGAWSLEDCQRLFKAAQALGLPLRVHGDQFNALGMVELAIEMGFVSVDHLEATGPESLERLAASETFGVMLPSSGFQVDDRYGDGRAFLDAGGALVIATNCNPGSAPTSSVPFAIALATRKLGLTTAEAISACTVNAGALLGFTDRGTLASGMRADIILLRDRDERMLGYEFGGDPVECVISGGRIVRPLL